ncbi:MAG: ABC transporter substrate-binding protein [Gammaproteobacteria bacterium]
MREIWLTLLLLIPGLAAVDTAAETADPNTMIQGTADALFLAMNGRREQLEADRPELYRIVDEVLLPRFDRNYAGRLVLAKHWRTASAEQRAQFVQAFYEFLVRTYAKGLLRFADNPIRVLPFRPGTKEGRATVRTEVTLSDGKVTPVSYSLRFTDGSWLIWDVTIEGISYIKNYRTDFNVDIRRNGIDAAIARLEQRTTKQDASE